MPRRHVVDAGDGVASAPASKVLEPRPGRQPRRADGRRAVGRRAGIRPEVEAAAALAAPRAAVGAWVTVMSVPTP